MADMKFKFTIQGYQTDAVNSVINVFAGQPYQNRVSYVRDLGAAPVEDFHQTSLFNELEEQQLALSMGFANAPVVLDEDQILHNIRDVQANNNIKQTDTLTKHMGACSLDVEMETGERVIIVIRHIRPYKSRLGAAQVLFKTFQKAA